MPKGGGQFSPHGLELGRASSRRVPFHECMLSLLCSAQPSKMQKRLDLKKQKEEVHPPPCCTLQAAAARAHTAPLAPPRPVPGARAACGHCRHPHCLTASQLDAIRAKYGIEKKTAE